MLADILSLLVAYYSIELAKKTEATKENSYGFQRAEIVGSLINSIFLLALCLSLLLQVIQRFISISGFFLHILSLLLSSSLYPSLIFF